MSSVMGAGVKPTRGFLLDLKKRTKFIEEGYKLLEMKREELARELRFSLDELAIQRSDLEKKFEKALQTILKTYASLGSGEIESYRLVMGKKLEVETIPKSVMGVLIPYLKIIYRPILKELLKI
jgi:V/A-type H+-transporting ATPase subunit D